MDRRKEIDYSTMYAALDTLMATDLPQMELYREIGRVIHARTEKGAAVRASEYLQTTYPEASGFSPRNTRRMRKLYRTYESSPALLDMALEIGWTQNVVILEAELTLEEKAWYIQAVRCFGWSKRELIAKIAEQAHEHESLDLDVEDASCPAEQQAGNTPADEDTTVTPVHQESEVQRATYQERLCNAPPCKLFSVFFKLAVTDHIKLLLHSGTAPPDRVTAFQISCAEIAWMPMCFCELIQKCNDRPAFPSFIAPKTQSAAHTSDNSIEHRKSDCQVLDFRV